MKKFFHYWWPIFIWRGEFRGCLYTGIAFGPGFFGWVRR